MEHMILDYMVFNGNLDDISLNERNIINTLNPHSYVVAKKDKVFQNALKSSTILIPDGIGIVYAAQILDRKKIKKIAGYDAYKVLLEKLNEKEGICFFLGSSQKTLRLIKVRLEKEYPSVKMFGFSPPFKAVFTEKDNYEMLNAIKKVKPDVLFVGMTAPKQEKWVFINENRLEVPIICSIGAVFDFYAGTVKRPNRMFVVLGLEWLGRLITNPKRMWRRTFISMPVFLKDVFSFKLKKFFNG